MTLKEEERRAGKLLKRKTVRRVRRHRRKELLVEFTDGTRLFVDWQRAGIELSITL